MLPRLIFILIFLKCIFIQAQVQLVNFTKDNVLTSNQITCYFVDSKGLVWLGTESGLNAYSAGKWYSIKSITNDKTGKDEQLGRVAKIYEDTKRNIWVSTINGLFVYNSQYWVHYIQEEEEKLTASNIIEDRLGRIWFGLENIKKFEDFINLQVTMVSGIVYMFNYESWYRISQMSGSVALKYNIPPRFFTSFLQDKAGNIWIGSLEGLFRFYGDKIVEIENDELQLIKVFGVIQDVKGNIWVASEKGVYKYADNKWLKFCKKDGLSGDFFYDIKEDPSGRIWAFSAVDMRFTGLSMYDGKNWQQYDNDAIHLKASVENLFWWEDEVLAFSSAGVSRFDSTGWHRFDKKDGLSEKKYSIMVRDKYKNIWLAGDKGFFQYQNGKWVKLYEPFDDWIVTQIFTDKQRRLWISTSGSGVFYFENNKWKHFTVEDGLPDNSIFDVFEDKKSDIWFITKKGVAKTQVVNE